MIYCVESFTEIAKCSNTVFVVIKCIRDEFRNGVGCLDGILSPSEALVRITYRPLSSKSDVNYHARCLQLLLQIREGSGDILRKFEISVWLADL